MKNGGINVAPGSRDLTLVVLSVLLIGTLIAATFTILRPFLLSMVWAVMLAVATWPLLVRVQARVRSRTLAVVLMSSTLVLLFIVPLLMVVGMLLGSVDPMTRAVQQFAAAPLPPPPAWVSSIPIVGDDLAARWLATAAKERSELAADIAPYVADALQWLAASAGSAGLLLVQVVLTLVIAAIVYARGEAAREAALRFARRLAGERGEHAVLLAGRTIRAVALGVVVTALVQALLAGIGLAIAGVPFAGLLTAAVLLLCLAQIGPLPVLAVAVAWLFWQGHNAAGVGLAVWSVVVVVLDNVLRPLLIRSGADVPLLLIFAGVIGGLLAFGVVGLFIGPVVLAVAYRLLTQWIGEQQPAERPAG